MLLKGNVSDSIGGIPAPVYKSDASGKSLGVGTLADIDGNYSLDNVNVGEYITASFVGLKPQTKIVSQSPLNFNLSTSSSVDIKTFEVVDNKVVPKASQPKALPPKENWFKRREKSAFIIINLFANLNLFEI